VLFIRKKALSVKETDLGDMFKKTTKSAFTLAVVLPPDSLFPTPYTSSPLKSPENTGEEPDEPEPAGEVGI
jgi:hypothetical protein